MLPIASYINIIFIATAVLAIILFYHASRKSKITLSVLLGWALAQSVIGYSGFYAITNTTPPRFILMILPPIILIISLFLTKAGKRFIDLLDLKWLTIIHIVRLPIEVVLYLLFLAKAVPQIMTFEGRNFDILMGISAPIIYYFSFVKQRISGRLLLLWNILGVILVSNVAITGILSTPVAFQHFAFDQPNIAVLHFPFNLLPSLEVPLVLFSHFASIRKIIQTSIEKKHNDNANVIIFPPLLFLITAVLALSTKFFLHTLTLPIFIQQSGYVWLAIGFSFLVTAVRQLNKHKTTVHPDGVTTVIISNGIFRYSRNPIYLSFTLLYIGFILLFNAVAGLVFLLPLLVITQKGIIEREEIYLTEKFGEDYLHYKSNVRRWF